MPNNLTDEDVGLGPVLSDEDVGIEPFDLGKVKPTPYEAAKLEPGYRTMGPFGTLEPEETLNLPQVLQIPGAVLEPLATAASDLSSDFLRRTGIDPSAAPGKPTINIPRIPNVSPGGVLLKTIAPKLAEGLERGGGEVLSGFTEPGQLAMLPAAAAAKPLGLLYGASMAGALPESVKAAVEAPNAEERGRAIAQAAAEAGMALGMAHGLPERAAAPIPQRAPMRPPPIPAVSGRTLKMPKGAEPPVKPVEPTIEPPPVKPEPPVEQPVVETKAKPDFVADNTHPVGSRDWRIANAVPDGWNVIPLDNGAWVAESPPTKGRSGEWGKLVKTADEKGNGRMFGVGTEAPPTAKPVATVPPAAEQSKLKAELEAELYPEETPTVAAMEGKAKEPWEMTKAEWFDHKWAQIPKKAQKSIVAGEKGFANVDEIRRQADSEHRRNVERAARESIELKPEVLADYPDLKPPTPEPAPKPTEPTALPPSVPASEGTGKGEKWVIVRIGSHRARHRMQTSIGDIGTNLYAGLGEGEFYAVTEAEYQKIKGIPSISKVAKPSPKLGPALFGGEGHAPRQAEAQRRLDAFKASTTKPPPTPPVEPPAVASDAKSTLMRDWMNKATSLAETSRWENAGGGLPAGATGFDAWIKSETIFTFLRHIRTGLTPEAAEGATKSWAREAIAIHNKKRPKDVNWARWEGHADSAIENLRREFESAEKGQLPKGLTEQQTAQPAVAKVERQVEKVARTEGQRPAKEVKSEVVERLEKEINDLIRENDAESNVLQKSVDGSRWYYANTWFDVEKNKAGSYVLTSSIKSALRGEDLSTAPLIKGTFKTIEEAEWFAKAMGSTGSGKVTIDIPGDGTFTMFRHGPGLIELWQRANRIDTKAEGKAKDVPSGEHGKVDADEIVKTSQKMYGSNDKAIAGLERQLASEQEFDPGQRDLIERAVQLLREDTPEFKREKRIEELRDQIESHTNSLKKARERIAAVKSEMKSAAGTSKQRVLIRDNETLIRNLETQLPARKAELSALEQQRTQAQPPPGPGAQTAGAISIPPLRPAASPMPPNVPVKAISQIIRDLSKGLNTPIRFGRLTTTKFAGYFKKIPNLIGSKRANDLPTVSHEVGHKLNELFKISDEPTLAGELDALGDPARLGPGSSWKPGKGRAYKLDEGVAEYVRQWIDDPAQARANAPTVDAYFAQILSQHNDLYRLLHQAQEDVRVWKNSPSLARLDSSIVKGAGPVQARYGISNLTRDLVDDLNFVRLAEEEGAKGTGAELPASRAPYILSRLLRGAYGMADVFIRKGIVDFTTKAVKMGTGFEQITKPVSSRMEEFRRFIVAKRAKELRDQGRETGLQSGDVDEALRVYQNEPEFQATFDKLKAWNDSLLQYSVDSGLVSRDAARVIRQMNQDYVPMHRFFEIGAGELNAEQGAGTGRGLNVGTPGSLKRLKGSGRDIVDPLETMIRNAHAIITASEKNAINVALADLSNLPGMGKWVERIRTPIDPHRVELRDIRKKLEDMGADLTNVPEDLELLFFRRAGRTPYGENIIKVNRGGQTEYYRLNGDLYETFHALDYDMASKFIKLISVPAQILRSGVTLSPDFAVSNSLRDTLSAAVISKYTMIPFYHTAKGVLSLLGIRDPKIAAEWAAAGGKQAIEATYFDAAKIQRFLTTQIAKTKLSPKERALWIVDSPFRALRRFTGLLEEGTRVGQYELAYKKLRSEGVPEGDARRMAAFEARDLQDFAKGGANTKSLRMIAAFWNAQLQANIRLAQSFRQRPIKTLATGLAFITLPKLIEQAINWNDDDYWDRPQWERDLFFMFPYGKDENGKTKFIRVPTPFEVGVIFGTLPGRITHWLKFNRPDAMTGFPALMLKQTIPNPMPQWVLTMLETVMGKQGYSLYRGRPIVPTSLADEAPELQATEQTSLTAKRIGRLLKLSPAKVDYAIQGTTGGIGRFSVHQGMDRLIEELSGEKRTAQNVMPGGRFISTPAGIQSDALERFYRALESARAEASRAKSGKPYGKEAELLPALESASRRFSAWRRQARQSTDPKERQRIAILIAQEAKQLMDQVYAIQK